MNARRDDYRLRARREIERGRLWRAKEILRGNIAWRPFDPEVYRQYGELLKQLGEEPDAGLYLFLSGTEDEQHRDTIALFLDRYGGSGSVLHSRFPARARFLKLEYYPRTVREVLQGRGFKGGKRDPNAPPGRQPATLRSTLQSVGGWTFFLIFIACLIVGFVTIVRWLFAL